MIAQARRRTRFLAACIVTALAVACGSNESLGPLDDPQETVVAAVTFGNGNYEIRQLDLSGNVLARFLTDSVNGGYFLAGSLLPSPDGSRIIYEKSPSNGMGVPIIGRLVIRGTYPAFVPSGFPVAWAADGSRLLWKRSEVFSPTGIITSGANGESPDSLANGEDPAWFVDDTRIIYAYQGTASTDVAIASMASPGITANVTHDSASDAAPAPTPDGHYLAWISDRSPGPGLFLLDLTSGMVRQLYAGSNLVRPVWSFDNRFVLTATADTVVVLNTDGSVHARISVPGLAEMHWARTRDLLLVSSVPPAGGQRQAFVVNDDGTERRQLTFAPDRVTLLAWLPR